jgi:hypothetical protein
MGFTQSRQKQGGNVKNLNTGNMIENKELGLKIAENPLEILWENVRKQSELHIKQMEDTLIIEKAVLLMAAKKLNLLKRKRK